MKVGLYIHKWARLARPRVPVVEINGEEFKCPWGVHAFEVPAGRHHVRVWFPYFTMPMCGLNEIEVLVQPGEVCRVQFSMPPWMLMKGQLVEVNRFTEA